MNSHDLDHLRSLNACPEAVAWAKTQPSLRMAWRRCKDGSWLLWYAAKVGVDRRALVLAVCECARLALRHVPDGEDRPRKAIETAEAWARGEATLNQVRKAANAAAYTAYAAVNAANAAAYAAVNAADAAANAAAYVAARTKTLAKCATIVRRHIPTLPEV